MCIVVMHDVYTLRLTSSEPRELKFLQPKMEEDETEHDQASVNYLPLLSMSNGDTSSKKTMNSTVNVNTNFNVNRICAPARLMEHDLNNSTFISDDNLQDSSTTSATFSSTSNLPSTSSVTHSEMSDPQVCPRPLSPLSASLNAMQTVISQSIAYQTR